MRQLFLGYKRENFFEKIAEQKVDFLRHTSLKKRRYGSAKKI
jgi:hypothetical protein